LGERQCGVELRCPFCGARDRRSSLLCFPEGFFQGYLTDEERARRNALDLSSPAFETVLKRASCRDAALLLDYYRLRAVYLAYPTVKGQSQIDDVFATAVKGLKATHEAAWYESLKDYYQKAVAFGLAVHYPRDAVSLKVTIEPTTRCFAIKRRRLD
jgi:hypothetical protein